jgi:hypothetical protein
VTEVNDPPVADDDAVTVAEDSATTAIDVLTNDSDPDLDPSTVSVTDPPTRGVAVPQPDGTIDYTPTPDESGADTFQYEVCDTHGACSRATVAVTITAMPDAPDAVDDTYGTGGGLVLSVPAGTGLLANDTDPDGDPLTVDVLPVSGPSLGVLVLDADGSFLFTPLPLVSGTDTFVYRVRDGTGRTATATATITVGP